MTTFEKIKEEFISRYPKNYANEPELGGRSCVFSLNEVLQIIDKYAEQEPILDKIRKEIADNHDYYFFAENNKNIALGLKFALDIIDEHQKSGE